MPVGITQTELDIFKKNGLTDKQVKETIDNYRTDGLSDDDIRKKIDAKLTEFSSNETTPQQVGANTYALGATKSYIGGKTQPSNLGALELPADLVEGALPIVGSIGGGVKGGAIGATAGTAIAPGIGTAIGGILGAATGAGLGSAGGAGIRRGIETLRGEKPYMSTDKNIALENMKYIGGEGAGGFLGELAGFGIAKAAQPITRAVAPALSKVLSAIPEEQTVRFMDLAEKGSTLFKEKPKKIVERLGQTYQGIKQRAIIPKEKLSQQFSQIADNALETLNTRKKELGNASIQFQKALEDMPEAVVNVQDLLTDVANKLGAKQFMGEFRIPESDVNTVRRMGNELMQMYKRTQGNINPRLAGEGKAPTVSLAQLNNFKTRWQSELKSLWREGGISSEGKALISDVIGGIREKIYESAPSKDLFHANEAFTDYLDDIYNPLVKNLQGKGKAGFLEKVDFKDAKTRNALASLDEMTGGNLSQRLEQTRMLSEQNKDVTKLLKDSDLRNPMNILNKTPDEIQRIKDLDPNAYEQLLNARAALEFNRPFAFSRSPQITNRVEQEQVLQQQNVLKSLLGLGGGYASGGLTGAGLGIVGLTAAQSPALQGSLLRAILNKNAPQVGGAIGTGIGSLMQNR